jgi:uncharacterized protein YfaS (alpha-2-macroglobulin family)
MKTIQGGGIVMGKTRARISLVILVCLALLVPASCRRKAPSRLSGASTGEIQGALGIVHAGPRGATAGVRESDEIVVVFDHPMAPLSERPFEDSTAVFKIDPAVDGSFRWMGTRTLAFIPKSRLPYATEFKVTVPSGTRSLDGFALDDDYVWTFETLRPRLVRHLPADDEQQLRLETEAVLVFNQPMDASKVREFVSFSGVDESGRTDQPAFDLSRPDEKILKEADIPVPPERAVILHPRGKLQIGFSYVVELKSGLTGREGRLPLEENALFRFSTFNAFRFKGLDEEENRDPHQALVFNFSNRVMYKEFVEKIRIEPKIEIPEYYREWDHGNTTLWISLPLQPDTKYSVILPADLLDDFGNVLGRDETCSFTTGPLPAFVRLTTGSGIVESYGDLTYPLFAVNTPEVTVRAARVKPDQAIPLLNSDRVFSSQYPYSPYSGFYSYNRPLPLKLPRNEREYVPIALRDIEPDGHGFVFLELETFSEDEWLRYPKTFLQLTELGISGKFSPENNVIWVSALKTGEPAPGAEVEIRDDRNRVLWKGQTGPDGRVETPGWKALGLRPINDWSKPRQWVIARLGEDAVLAASDDSEGVEPYRFDIYYDWDPEPARFQGTIFSERGIYRAGETVHLKGILRERAKGVWAIPAIREANLEIQDPFSKSVFKSKSALDAYGSFAVDFETREDAPLGTYSVTAVIPKSSTNAEEARINETFRVDAFRPAEFEVHLKSLRDAYVIGDTYEAEVRASYLFGGSLSAQKASWSLRLNPSWVTPPGHAGFVFGREIEDWSEDTPSETSRLVGSGEGTLDKDGLLTVKVPLVAEKERGTLSADLEATVQSPSRRSISSRIQTTVHPGDFYLGLKPSTSFLKKGDPLSVQVIAALPDGTLQNGRAVTVKLIKRVWKSVRKAGLGGRLEWISEKSDTEIASQEVKTAGPEPAAVRFQPDQSGFYMILAEARDGSKHEISSSTYLYVTGNDYVPWERDDDDIIELVADADSYKPGDTARILVKSPYEKAKALVTVEREFIMKSEVVEIVGSTSEIAIPVTSDMIPNAYVSVLLIQGRTSNAAADAVEDAGKPSFKIGYAELSVDPAEKRLGLEIQTNQAVYKPGDSVELRLKAKNSRGEGTAANLAVAVVDVGVINLIGYQTPDPFAAFYGERPLSVETAETRVHVVGQRHFGEKGENPGGGGSEKMGGLSLSEVQLRGDFKSTAYWNPSVTTDTEGNAVVKFKLPDNLTTFRVMSVAQTTDSRFGRNSADFKVAKPLLMLPALPRFARVGDSFQGGVLLTNNGGTKGTVRLSLKAGGLLTKDRLEQTFDLEPGASREALFAFKAETAGRAVLEFRAAMDEYSDGLEAIVPVEHPRPMVTLGFSGQADTKEEEIVRIPPDIYPDLGEIDLRASASALNGLRTRLDELVDYPYLCLEQRLSRVLPFLIASPVIRDFKLSSLSPAETDKMVRDSLREVYACQKDNGGFSLWSDSTFDSPYVSAYAVFALLKAYEAGIPIDKSRLESGLDYLRTILKTKFDPEAYPYNHRGWASVQAFALYNLALAGRPDAAYGEKLFQEREGLPLFGRALLLKAFHRFGPGSEAENTLAREFLNQAKITAADAHFEESDPSGLTWVYSSNTRTTAIILQALLETGKSGPVLSGATRWLVQKKSAPGWPSTQENFFVFYALNEYYRRVEKGAPDFRAQIKLAEKILLDESFREPSAEFHAAVPLAAFPKDRNLPFLAEKTGTGLLYYSLRMSYAPQKSLPPQDSGFAVYKKIETTDGRPLAEIPAGTLAVVTLEIAVPKESLFVVVEDPLPAGFEAVNANFRTESEERFRTLAALDENDDRPWWDGFQHVEMHDNRVLLFADSLQSGVHRYRYLVRALTFGAFGAPGARVQQMYAPEIYGRGAEQTVKIIK